MSTKPNGTDPKPTLERAAALQAAIIGNQIAYQLRMSAHDYGLDQVSEADLASFEVSIGLWKQIRDGMSYKTCEVKAADTLMSIVRFFYSDQVLSTIIYDANRDAFLTDKAMTPGLQLTIPGLTDKDKSTSYTVQPGQTRRDVAVIALECYPDVARTAVILGTKVNNLKSAYDLRVGQMLTIPDLVDDAAIEKFCQTDVWINHTGPVHFEVYQVQRGDTLQQILLNTFHGDLSDFVHQFATYKAQVLQMNHLSWGDPVAMGQLLKLPVTAPYSAPPD
jgi:hypothetical protein